MFCCHTFSINIHPHIKCLLKFKLREVKLKRSATDPDFCCFLNKHGMVFSKWLKIRPVLFISPRCFLSEIELSYILHIAVCVGYLDSPRIHHLLTGVFTRNNTLCMPPFWYN